MIAPPAWVDALAASAASVVIAAALVVAALAVLATRSADPALPLLLDLLLAAGLLRLSADLSWEAVATAAGIVAIRRIVALGLRSSRRAAPLRRRRPTG